MLSYIQAVLITIQKYHLLLHKMGENSTSCTNVTADQLEARKLSRSVSAMICTAITLTILLAMILNRAYKTTLQRLFLYLTTMVLIQLIFISMNIELQFKFEQREEICSILAFFTAWSAASTYLLAMVTTLYLLYIMYKQIKGDNTFKLTQSFGSRILMDVLVIIFCIISPLCYMWVPFYHGTYGSTPVACWVINTRETDCKFLGFQDQLGLSFGIFFVTSLVILIAFAGVAVLFCTFAAKYKLTRHHHLNTICQTLTLMGFMTISALIEIFGVIQFLYNTVSGKQLPFEILVIYAGAIPLSQMLIPLGFTITFTLSKS